MADKQIKQLLNHLSKNPELLTNVASNAGTFKNIASSLFPGSSSSQPANELLNALRGPSSSETVKNALEGLANLNNIRNIIIVIFILGGVSFIISRILVKDKDQKENVDFAHRVIFGDSGIIPFTAYIWPGILTVITILPILTDVLPKLGNFLDLITKLFPK